MADRPPSGRALGAPSFPDPPDASVHPLVAIAWVFGLSAVGWGLVYGTFKFGMWLFGLVLK